MTRHSWRRSHCSATQQRKEASSLCELKEDIHFSCGVAATWSCKAVMAIHRTENKEQRNDKSHGVKRHSELKNATQDSNRARGSLILLFKAAVSPLIACIN